MTTSSISTHITLYFKRLMFFLNKNSKDLTKMFSKNIEKFFSLANKKTCRVDFQDIFLNTFSHTIIKKGKLTPIYTSQDYLKFP